MMRERVQELRYEIGDAMGEYAPDYFRRSRSTTTEFLIGVGSMLTALGIGYLAMRFTDRGRSSLIDRLLSDRQTAGERPTVHGTSGAEMPDANRAGQRQSARRPQHAAVHGSDGAEWPKHEAGSRP